MTLWQKQKQNKNICLLKVPGLISKWGVCGFSFLPELHLPFLFLHTLLPFPFSFDLVLKIVFDFIFTSLNYSFRLCAMHNGGHDWPSGQSGLVSGHWMMPVLWSGGGADQIFEQTGWRCGLSSSSVVEPKLCLLRVPGSIPGWDVSDFFFLFLPKFHFPCALSLPFPFPLLLKALVQISLSTALLFEPSATFLSDSSWSTVKPDPMTALLYYSFLCCFAFCLWLCFCRSLGRPDVEAMPFGNLHI